MTHSDPPGPSRTGPSIDGLLHAGPATVPVTLALLLINTLVFGGLLIAGAPLGSGNSSVQLALGANFGPATQDGQWWRLVSALFLHFGIVHLVMNMAALWDVGRVIETLLGRWRYAALYLGAGVTGNLVSLAIQGNRAVSGGASGAIYGLYGAFLVWLWHTRGQSEPAEFRRLFLVAGGFTLVSLSLGLLIPGIDNAAHLGGLVSGALLAPLLAPSHRAGLPSWGHKRWYPAGLLVIALAVLIDRLPPPSYRLSEEIRAQAAIRQFLAEDRRLSAEMNALLGKAPRGGATFEQLAERIDTQISNEYLDSFEQLATLRLDPAAPSARALEELRRYAIVRGEASHDLAVGLRNQDAAMVRQALEKAAKAPAIARAASAPRAAASH